MPQIRQDNQRLADLADVYADAAPDLFDGLENAVTTARTLNEQQGNIDQALMASVGFGNTGGEIFEKRRPVPGPRRRRPARRPRSCSTSTARRCSAPSATTTTSNPKSRRRSAATATRCDTHSEILGAGNPYVYPDNLPRVNARGGPEGRPGCWQPITRDLWPRRTW